MTQFILLNIKFVLSKVVNLSPEDYIPKLALNLKLIKNKNRVLLAVGVKWVESNDETINI